MQPPWNASNIVNLKTSWSSSISNTCLYYRLLLDAETSANKKISYFREYEIYSKFTIFGGLGWNVSPQITIFACFTAFQILYIITLVIIFETDPRIPDHETGGLKTTEPQDQSRTRTEPRICKKKSDPTSTCTIEIRKMTFPYQSPITCGAKNLREDLKTFGVSQI